MKNRYSLFLILLCIIISFCHIQSYSQVTAAVTTGTNAVQNLVGSGITVSNIQTFTTSPNGIGIFNNGNSGNIGINSGVFLFTGDVNTAGPQLGNTPATFVSTDVLTPGDADLNTLSSPTFNASIIQFDFVPTGDTIKFRYVFASEEYNEFVNAGVNDVFGFFLTGPNPFGPAYVSQNIAVLPSTTIPVAIDNVNNGNWFGCAAGPCTNCAYYVDNLCNNNNFCFDGHTVVLTAIASVVPCSTYTIKLAIADVGDGVYDSGVFLEAGSFNSNLVSLSSEVDYGSTDTILYEGCSNATINFLRGGNLSGQDTISYTITGSGTMGTDFNNLPGFIVFAPGEDSVSLTISPFWDGISEGNETITITINDTICNNPALSTLTLIITNVDPLNVTAGLNDSLCIGDSTFLDANYTGGAGFSQLSWIWNNGPTPDSSYIIPDISGFYTIGVYDDCLDTTVYDSVYITIYPRINFSLPDTSVCSGTPLILDPGIGNSNYGYNWSPGSNLSSPQSEITGFLALNPGPGNLNFTYSLQIDSAGIVCSADTFDIVVFPLPDYDLTPDSTFYCENSDVTLDAGAGFSAYNWSNGITTQLNTVSTSGWYYSIIDDANGCSNIDSIYVSEILLPVFDLDTAQICEGDSVFFFVNSNIGDSYLWENGSTDTLIWINAPGNYWLEVTNQCGSSIDSATVIMQPSLNNVQLPNVFTPNGDGINDEYLIPALADAESFRIDIYNRWGRLLFSTSDFNEVWKGEGDNGTVVGGTYFVVLTYLNCYQEEFVINGIIQVIP